MTLSQRAAHFAGVFHKWPAAHLHLVREQGREVLYGTWLIGAAYGNETPYYGSYPRGYLDRVMALFPDAIIGFPVSEGPRVLHVFSGSLPPDRTYLRCDSHQPAELSCNVYDLPGVCARTFHRTFYDFQLVLADPPYSPADAEQYGTPMVDRRRALSAIAQVTRRGGHLVWLDVCWPMHAKHQWVTVGRITVIRSTNHRVRLLSIFERVAA